MVDENEEKNQIKEPEITNRIFLDQFCQISNPK